jgi:hypothetical protein
MNICAMNRNQKSGSRRKWGRSVAYKSPSEHFLTFVALLKSPLGRRFVLDSEFPGNHSARRNNANIGAGWCVTARAQQMRDEGEIWRRNGFEAKKTRRPKPPRCELLNPLG